MDSIFTARSERERQIADLERQIEQERNVSEQIVAQMEPDARASYDGLVARNKELEDSIRAQQADVSRLSTGITRMQADIEQEPVKQEAAELYREIRSLENKQAQIRAEIDLQKQESPQEQKRRLMDQVKEHAGEIKNMEERIKLGDKKA